MPINWSEIQTDLTELETDGQGKNPSWFVDKTLAILQKIEAQRTYTVTGTCPAGGGPLVDGTAESE